MSSLQYHAFVIALLKNNLVFVLNGNDIYVAELFLDQLSVIATATNTIVATVTLPVGSGPAGLEVTPNGALVYVADSISSAVSIVETTGNTLVTTLSLGTAIAPHDVAITPDGRYVYVTTIFEFS